MNKILIGIAVAVAMLFIACDSKNDKTKTSSSENVLRINLGQEPLSLDPRLARDQVSKCVVNMLYDGLVRLNSDGNPYPSVAEKIDISDDGKTYKFTLRDSYWTNGDLVTAHDFAYAWKRILDPGFPADCAHPMYVIENAKEAKEGKVSLDDVGIDVVDNNVLEVTLTQPISYFLDLLASTCFFPICRDIDENNGEWSLSTANNYVSNGPFKLFSWDKKDDIEVVKNATYWDAKAVKLDKIVIKMVDSETEAEMFENGELDWIGNGFTSLPISTFYSLANKEEVDMPSSATMYWFRFNNDRAPFNNDKMMQAFGYAIDRKLVIDDITMAVHKPVGEQEETVGVVENVDVIVAKNLFDDALQEMKIKKEDLPQMNLVYQPGMRNKKIAEVVQNQWKNIFGIDVQIQELDPLAYDEAIQSDDFYIATGFWPVDVSNDGYSKTNQPSLVEDMSLIPVYYYTVPYAKKRYVHDIFASEEGAPDFKWVSVE